MNLPNKLTMLRVLLVPVFMVFAAFGRIGTADYSPAMHLLTPLAFIGAVCAFFLKKPQNAD